MLVRRESRKGLLYRGGKAEGGGDPGNTVVARLNDGLAGRLKSLDLSPDSHVRDAGRRVSGFVTCRAVRFPQGERKAGEADCDERKDLGAVGASAALGQNVVPQGFVEEQLEAQE